MPARSQIVPPRAAAKKKPAAKPGLKTRAEIYRRLGDATHLSQHQVRLVFETYCDLMRKELTGKDPGVVLLPGVARIKATRLPARKERIQSNPFRPGETMTVRARPARTRLKFTPLKEFLESLA